MSEIVNSAGWSVWNEGDERIDNVQFSEYGNTGTGSEGTRASFASQLSAPLAMGDVLGDYEDAAWADLDFVSDSGSSLGPSVSSVAVSSAIPGSSTTQVAAAQPPSATSDLSVTRVPLSSAASSGALVLSGLPIVSSLPIVSQSVAAGPLTSTTWTC